MMMRRALLSFGDTTQLQHSVKRCLAYSTPAGRPRIRDSVAVSTSVSDAFTIPLTLVDIHLRDEQLPFAYFFKETLCAQELESSLARLLSRYPVLGGRVNLSSGVIECSPTDTVSLSFSNSKLSLQEWLAKPPIQRLTPGRAARVQSPLFDCLLLKDTTKRNHALASIRITHFKGGGTALGVNLSHVLADAASCVRFMECWGREHSGLPYPTASNQRSYATCSGMLSPELLEILDLENGAHKQQSNEWSLVAILAAMGIDRWTNDVTKEEVAAMVHQEECTDGKDSHEYVNLMFSPQLVKAMKAHGMQHCIGTETEFISTNDVLTAFGWLLKRRLSGRTKGNMSMVVNLRGRSDVENFSFIEDSKGRQGVFGNAITSIIATLPPGERDVCIKLDDLSAAAVRIRSAVTEGIVNIPDRLLHSRNGRPLSTPTANFDCFAITSWQQFPLYNISFSADEGLAAFQGHPSHPLPQGDTYNSIIVPERCGSHTYQLLAPSNKIREAEAFHNEMEALFLEWYYEYSKTKN